MSDKVPTWLPAALVVAVAICLFTIRLAAPPNLRDSDQEGPASYVLDVVKNGHWICQHDFVGEITSKPPLYTWLCALVTLACGGRINLFAMYLPGALAVLATAGLVWGAARKHFGVLAGLFGALACFLSAAGVKQFGLARTDAVFAFTVTWAALSAYRAWTNGQGWLWFWVIGAIATLTKGPLGPVLAAGGLLAVWWERRSGERLPLRGSHVAGIALFLLITVGWFCLAYWQEGEAVARKLIGRELVRHVASDKQGNLPGFEFYVPPGYFLLRFAPWSLPAVVGLWRVWKKPAAQASERRFERFVFCWFVLGLILFSLAPHQRADLLWPILPAAALLAGRELARWTQSIKPARILRWTGAAAVGALLALAFYYFGPRTKGRLVRETMDLKAAAQELRSRVGAEFPLTHVDVPMTLQFYLNTMRPRISPARAAELLRGPETAFVAVSDMTRLRAAWTGGELHEVFQRPVGSGVVRILSNQPQLQTSEKTALCFGPIFLQWREVQLVQATEKEFRFAAGLKPGEIALTNESDQSHKVRIRIEGWPQAEERVLASRESWKIAAAPSPPN